MACQKELGRRDTRRSRPAGGRKGKTMGLVRSLMQLMGIPADQNPQAIQVEAELVDAAEAALRLSIEPEDLRLYEESGDLKPSGRSADGGKTYLAADIEATLNQMTVLESAMFMSKDELGPRYVARRNSIIRAWKEREERWRSVYRRYGWPYLDPGPPEL